MSCEHALRARTLLLALISLVLGLLVTAGCGSDDCPRVATGWRGRASATRVSMAAVCGQDGCPADKRSAILRVEQQAQLDLPCGPGVEAISGCGFDWVGADWGTNGEAWLYDHKSGALIGADRFDDTSF